MNEKSQWFRDISKLKNDYSQILYLIYYLYNIKEINKEQKLLLKNLVLSNKDAIFKSLQNLKLTHNIKDFSTSIKKIISESKNNDVEQAFIGKGKIKHLITISDNTSMSDNKSDNDKFDELNSPQIFIKKLNKK